MNVLIVGSERKPHKPQKVRGTPNEGVLELKKRVLLVKIRELVYTDAPQFELNMTSVDT